MSYDPYPDNVADLAEIKAFIISPDYAALEEIRP
jgi:hypothetical protein